MTRLVRLWSLRPLLAAAAAVVLIVLVVPISSGAAAKPASAGPMRLADRWPKARLVSVEATLPDGDSYTPAAFVGAVSVGTAVNPAQTIERLVIRDPAGAISTVRQLTVDSGLLFVGIVVNDGQLYWLETGQDVNGGPATDAWTVPIAGGVPRRLSTDDQAAMYVGSSFDTQVVDGRLYWLGSPGSDTQLHSVAVTGGPESVQPLDNGYAMTAWPWVTTANDGNPGPAQMRNLVTGASYMINAGPQDILSCTPTWCLLSQLSNEDQTITSYLQRADGTGRRPLGDATMTPVNVDSVLLNRYEILSIPVGSQQATTTTEQMWLCDVSAKPGSSGVLCGKDDPGMTLLAGASSGTFGYAGSVIWWSTGDNETLTWHALDLGGLH
jgi:hypothetical protein